MKQLRSKKKRILLPLLALIALLIVAWTIWGNVTIETCRISIQSDKLPSSFQNFKIVQISDLHNHAWGDKLTDRIRKEAPDMIVVTGDLVDSSRTDVDVAMELIDQAVKIAPTYYVTGNHEAWLNDYESLERRLSEAGVHLMDDKRVWIERGGARINLIGLQDPDFTERGAFDGVQESMVTTKLKGLLIENCYNVVLCHRPELFEGYVKTGADLVLTGHAHGGQVRIPFIGGLVAPNQGLFPRYTEGVYRKGGTDMVVSRGLGNSILPIRINNPPELLVITLSNDLN